MLELSGEILVRFSDTALEFPMSDGCATVSLKALRVGDTKISAKLGKLESKIDISSFTPLKVRFLLFE